MILRKNSFFRLWVALGPLSCIWTLGCASDGEPLEAVTLGNGGCGDSGTPAECPAAPVGGTGGSGGAPPSCATFNNAEDSTIYKHQPNSNYAAQSTCNVDAATAERACVIRWDLSAIPTNATVSAARVTLWVQNPAPTFFAISPLLRAWAEPEVTWNRRVAQKLGEWEVAGAKGPSDRGTAMTSFCGTTGRRTVRLWAGALAQVQNWVTNPASNHGVIVSNPDNTDDLYIVSSEGADLSQRPQITVDYTVP